MIIINNNNKQQQQVDRDLFFFYGKSFLMVLEERRENSRDTIVINVCKYVSKKVKKEYISPLELLLMMLLIMAVEL